MAKSYLGILADHAEPENRRPGALLLAGVGDDDHRKGGGLKEIVCQKKTGFWHYPIINVVNIILDEWFISVLGFL